MADIIRKVYVTAKGYKLVSLPKDCDLQKNDLVIITKAIITKN